MEDGHPWVYGNEIDTIVGEPKTGDIVEVYNFRNEFIGKGYINELSQITVRILSRNKSENIDIDFSEKIIGMQNVSGEIKLHRKLSFMFWRRRFLPALVIDKFNDNYVIQTLSAGMDKWKSVIVEILLSDFNAKGIYERNDVPVRKLEGLEEIKGFYPQNLTQTL